MGAWGLGLRVDLKPSHPSFQSDQDLDVVSDLGYEAGLDKLQEEAKKRAKANKPKKSKTDGNDKEDKDFEVYLDLQAGGDDPELVRKHLDSGVLSKLVTKKLAKASKLTEPPGDPWDPRYELMLLGACAMTLGCTLPAPLKDHMKKNYKTVGLMRDAKKQMEAALDEKTGFKDGEPYEFEHFEAKEEDRLYPSHPGAPFQMLNVQAPFGMPPLPDSFFQEMRDEREESQHGDNACGGCGAKAGEGKTLMACGKCKFRKYCSKECQKAHWKLHKKVCKAPEGKENVKA